MVLRFIPSSFNSSILSNATENFVHVYYLYSLHVWPVLPLQIHSRLHDHLSIEFLSLRSGLTTHKCPSSN